LFRLAKPAVPIIVLTVLAAMLSVFVHPVWWIPLLAVPGYWICALFPAPGKKIILRDINGSYEDLCGYFGMLEVTTYEGKVAKCNGISTKTKYIIIPMCLPEKVYGKLSRNYIIKTMVSHELSHLCYNHPLINVIYFTMCCICSASCLYLNPIIATLFVFGIIPVTIWKTMQMEVAADRLADSFSDMRALLKTHPDDSIRKMRLAALDGKRG
jgi:hypothetical protein